MKDIEVLKNGFASLEKELKKAGNIIEQSKAVTEKQKNEIKLLKAALAESKRHSDQVHSNLVETKQVVKAKDKEIHNLSKTIENKNDHISSLKQSNGDLKSAKSKLETKIRNFEKKILKTVVSSATQTCCTSDALCLELHEQLVNLQQQGHLSSLHSNFQLSCPFCP